MTLESRSRSPIFELVQDFSKVHLWCKYGRQTWNILWDIVFTRIFNQFPLWPWKVCHGHPPLDLFETLLRCISHKRVITICLIFLEISHSQAFHKSRPVTLESRSRSPIFDLVQDICKVHLWCESGSQTWNISWDIVFTRIFNQFPLWPWKVRQGHPTSNLT